MQFDILVRLEEILDAWNVCKIVFIISEFFSLLKTRCPFESSCRVGDRWVDGYGTLVEKW